MNRSSYGGREHSKATTNIWDWPIWHLPLLQIGNHAHLTLDIVKAERTRKERISDLSSLAEMDFMVSPTLSKFLKEKCVDEALVDATKRLSSTEAKFLSTKLMEAVFESGPQFILQLSIILKVGNVEGHQAAAMLISLVSFWLSVTRFCFQMPTKNTPLRAPTFTDFAVTFLPMLVIILSRFAAWSFLLAYLGFGILVPIVAMVAYMIGVHWRMIDFSKDNDIVELCANILVPCITQDEFREVYQSGSAVTNIVLMAATSSVILLAPAINSGPPILTCYAPDDWSPASDDIRCQYNSTDNQITRVCIDRLLNFGLGFGFDKYRTICSNPNKEDVFRQLMVFHACCTLFGLLFFNQLLATYCIQPLLDPVVRLKMLGTWNEFYETKATDALDALHHQHKDSSKLNCNAWSRLFLTATRDNIQPLISVLVDSHGTCTSCGDKAKLLKLAYKKCAGNVELRDKIQSAYGHQDLSQEVNNDAIDTVEVKTMAVEVVVPLDLKHCKTSLAMMKKRMKEDGGSVTSPGEVLHKLIMEDDLTSISHFLHCHKHLCSKVFEVCKKSGGEGASFVITRDQLLDMIILPDPGCDEQINNDNFSQIIIQLKHHITSCEEMIQSFIPPNRRSCVVENDGPLTRAIAIEIAQRDGEKTEEVVRLFIIVSLLRI